MAVKTNKLTIYLIKDSINDFSGAVEPGLMSFVVPGVGIFYAEDSFIRTPGWVKDFFGNALDGADFSFRTASAQGVLLANATHNGVQRMFAVVFGQGRHLLAPGVVEERFGLKVVLNSIEKDSLRSIDKTTLGSVPKQSREQMSRETGAAGFGLDIEQDLISAINGTSKDSRFGKTISGRDPLAVSVKVDLTNVATFLPVCLEQYQSTAYKADFDWVDQIKGIHDSVKTDELNDWLIEKLAAKDFDKVWMAPPTVLDWVDVKGFKYGKPKRGELQLDLDAAAFVESLEDKDLSVQLLKNVRVFAISEKNDAPLEQWTAYKCLYAEAEIAGAVFVLNSGSWYEIAPDFTTQVLNDFNAMPESALALADYAHQREGEYNTALAAALPGSQCLDADLISHGGGHSAIEFCDVLTAAKQLIHVKRYSGSADLSHLFNQGVVSAELFVSASDFREKLNAKLDVALKLADTNIRPPADEFEVVFAIIMGPGKALEVPFFSKVSLRNARRRLLAYGYQVTKKKVASVPPAAA